MKIRTTLTLALTVVLCSGPGPAALAQSAGGMPADSGAVAGKHFDPKGKMPSKFTIELRNGLRKTLPFEDKRDVDEAKKGFVAAPAYRQIMAEAGNVAWDMGSY